MNDSRLSHKLEKARTEIDCAILQSIENNAWPVPVLKEAVSYSISGGKRLRGIILLSVFQELGGSGDHAMEFAVAIEMIQAYSLVHDDMPCMDDDDYRRGKPTCHRKFGEAMALLCGDSLLTMAFETMLSANALGVPNGLRLTRRAASEIARAAGPRGMIGGQVLDLLLEKSSWCKDDLSLMHKMKTGALFEVSAKTGAILAGCDSSQVEAAASWGRLFGYAYQIIDDVEDSAKGGKEDSKNTFVKQLSREEALNKAARILRSSIEAVSSPGFTCSLLARLSNMYLEKIGE